MLGLYDLKTSLRRVVRDYNYNVLVVLTFAVTLAIALFLFSVVYAIQFKPLPNVEAPNRIVWGTLRVSAGEYTIGGLSNHTYEYIKENQTSLDDFGRIEGRMVTLSDDQLTQQISGVAVSHELFAMLGVAAVTGRVLQASDDVAGSQRSVVISYRLWESLFDRAKDIAGRTIKLDGEVATIVGVMPNGFRFPVNHDLWFNDAINKSGAPDHGGWNSIFGRIKPDLQIANVEQDLDRLAQAIKADYPDQYKGKGVGAIQFSKRFAKKNGLFVSIVAIASLGILLIGCFSASNLVIVRNLEDAKNVLIKVTLGIPMFRIVGGLLLDAFWLCLSGTLLGLWLWYLAIGYFGLNLLEGPYWWTLEYQPRVLLGGLAAAVLIWVLTGVISFWMAARQPTNGLLASGRKGGTSATLSRVMLGFSTLQIFSSFVLMVFTGILIGGVIRLATADYGVTREGYLTAQVKLAGARYSSVEQRKEYFELFIDQALQSGIQGAAVTGALPGTPAYLSTFTSTERDIEINGAFPNAFEMPISVDYFQLMGIKLLEGRNFNVADKEGSTEVAIINQSMAHIVFPDESAFGRQLKYDPENGGKLLTVVGVVPDVVGENPLWFISPKSLGQRSQLYRPIGQTLPEWAPYTLVFRAGGDPNALIGGIKTIARSIDTEIPLYNIKSYDALLTENENGIRRLIYTFIPAAFVALMISALGVYGSTRRVVLQNIPDIGVMRAIGVEERFINRKYIRSSILQLVAGLCAGTVFCLVLLPKVPNSILITDSGSILSVSAIVSLIFGMLVLCASYLPLGIAHRLSPRDAMNYSEMKDD